jgi:starch phosphorylase
MTSLGFGLSHYINGVAKRHGEVSRRMFEAAPIDSITNGVHGQTWVAPPVAALFDRHISGWREDSFGFRNAVSIPRSEIRQAHQEAKRALIDYVARTTGLQLDIDILTIGYGRRATPYKRADLILSDRERLKRISSEVGPIQLVFAGKAHPADQAGKDLIHFVTESLRELSPVVRGVFLPNYDMSVCGLMVAGSDVWLNTPLPPLEASGTSGMKAAMNGVPSLSTLDGWWLEGWVENVTGWAIGNDDPERIQASTKIDPAELNRRDAESLYDKLAHTIVPMYYGEPNHFASVMRNTMALNGSFFNARRMVQEYVTKAYLD